KSGPRNQHHKHPQGCFFVSAAGKPLPKTGTAIAAPSPVCFMSSVTAPEIQETAIYQRLFILPCISQEIHR
ncbi:hypothetical protein, partial [Klebsiella variicola]|uniref:hypothetical protein n=1 Tax=Klebsiella variicola TaxID=244366 RepID=UPI001C65E6A0